MYRIGGHEVSPRYGGSFKTRKEALSRKRWVDGELAAMRVPDLALLQVEPTRAPTLTDAAEVWRRSRVDVAEQTANMHRSSVGRIFKVAPELRTRRIDDLDVDDLTDLIGALAAADYRRETIKKSRDALAMLLDFHGVEPNPARSKLVRLPREEQEEPDPPTADHVETVYRLLPSKHRLGYLFLEWSGARVSAVDLTLVSDYDEPRQRVRLRAATTKTRKALWIDLHPVLADAIEASLPPREDRDADVRLFASSGADALRTAMAKACRAAGIPSFSPHDLRHRRVSLLHSQGWSWARIGEFVGQRNISVTANTYTHVLANEAEVDYAKLMELRPPAHAGGIPM
jgi:integrase